MLDKDSAQDLSRELRIDLFTVYREYLQLLFLKYFYNQKESQKIYFKGGTALRFLYDSFRFSEDLDFTSLISEKRLKGLIDKSLRKLNKEATGISFKRMESIGESFSGKIRLELSELKFPLTIRLDFSMREKPVLGGESSYIETNFPVGPYPFVSHLKIEELLAEKVRAILTRSRGRDIFDIWFLFSKKVLLDWKLVNNKMALYKKKTGKKELIKAVEEFDQDEIKNDLTRFLPASHRHLINEIKALTLKKLKEN